jgi:hypothetical protein
MQGVSVDTQKRDLSLRDATHERLMRSILKGIGDTPLALEGHSPLQM